MAQIRETLTLYDEFTKTFTQYIRLGGQAASVTNQVDDSTEKLSQSQKAAANSADNLAGKLKSLIGGYLSLKGAQSMLSLSDTMTATTARLDMMNDGLQTTSELNDMIFQSASRARGSYQDMADMVAKLGTLAPDAFGSSEEIVAFAEQISKQMVIAGTSTTGAQAAMLQLTQAMSSGVLRGEELNSILEQTPTIAQAIADYMGVSVGKMREMASEGAITADVVKNAMFAAAEETNAKFEQMPMTWGQVWTQIQNIVIQASEPILRVISSIADNMDTLAPIFIGVASAVAIYAAAMAIHNAVTWLSVAANRALIATMLKNPFLWIAIAIGVVIAVIYRWVQAVGGLRIAWLIVVDAVLFAWDTLKTGFMTGVYWVMDLWDTLGFKLQSVGASIANFMGDTKVAVLTILQDMVNGAIDLINKLINTVNKLPGVSIETISHVTFASTAAIENEAAKAGRAEELEAARAQLEADKAERADKLAQMWAERDTEHAARQAEIDQLQAAAKAADEAGGGAGIPPAPDYTPELEGIGSDVGSIKKSISASDEDLKSLVDIAERRYVNRINVTAQTPVITVNGQNTGNTAADRQNLANAIRDILLEQAASGSLRSTARAF